MDDRSLDFEYLLHQLAGDQDRLREALVQTWYPFVRQYCYVLIDDVDHADYAVIETFRTAWLKLDQFPTGADFTVWLMRITHKAVNKHIKANRRRPINEAVITPDWLNEFKRTVPHLPQKNRFPVLMYLQQDLSIEQISETLRIRENTAYQRVNSGLEKIIPQVRPDFEIQTGNEHRNAHRALIYPEATLAEDIDSAKSHLLNCNDCQIYSGYLAETNEKLTTSLAEKQPTDHEKIRVLLDFLELEHTETRTRRRFGKIGKEVAWVGIAIAAFLALGVVFNRINPLTEVQNALTQLQDQSVFEPIVELPIATASIDTYRNSQADSPFPDPILGSWDPELSADGKWMVFSSEINTLVEGDTNQSQDIFVMDLETGDIQRVSVSENGDEATNGSFESSISGDGRFVVFSSWADNLTATDTRTCKIFGTQSSCPDIFLHDIQTGDTELVSKSSDGIPGNNFSITPKISANGNTVVYWSAASDLVPGDSRDCGVREETGPLPVSCLDIFIYNRLSRTTAQIPIGRSLETYLSIANVPMSISADGRWLVTSVRATDQIARELKVTSSPSLYVFDLITNEANPINVDSDGTPGNAPSFDASISADGRFIAFSSQASNLVEDDNNKRIDVFILDREFGTVERISERQDGSELDKDSGVAQPGRSWVGVGLDISDNGEWIIYSSSADDLARQPRVKCDLRFDCQNIFITNRKTKESMQLNVSNVEFLSFTSISEDGRYSVFMAHSPACVPGDFCSDIYLYDQSIAEVTRLGGYGSFPGLNNQSSPQFENSYVYTPHETRVTSVRFSPDNRILASGSWDGLIHLSNSATNETLANLDGNQQGVNQIAFSPKGDLLAAATQGNEVYLWRQPQNTILGILPGYPDIRALDFSKNGELLAMGGDGGVWLWHIQDGLLDEHLNVPDETLRSIDISPNGALLAAGGNDGTVRVWDLDSGKLKFRLGGHTDKINVVKFSPNGRFLASGSHDGLINVWTVELPDGTESPPQLFYTFEHEDWVTSLDFSPDSLQLVSGSFDSTVALWDLADPRLLTLLFDRRQNQVLSVDFSPDGSQLAAGTVGGEIHHWLQPLVRE